MDSIPRSRRPHRASTASAATRLFLLVLGAAALALSSVPFDAEADRFDHDAPLELTPRALEAGPMPMPPANKVDQELFCDDGSGETGIISASENWYGNRFVLPCAKAQLKSVRFTHFGFGFVGPYSYNLHILDDTCTELAVLNGLTAQNAAGTFVEEIVDLTSLNLCVETDFQIMVEPLSCADAPTNADCYPSVLTDLSPGGNPAVACARIRLPSGNCIQFTVSGGYTNYLMRATIDCDAPVCAGVQDSTSVGTAMTDVDEQGVTVPVSLVNSFAVGGFDFEITYDPGLFQVVGATPTSRTQNFEIFSVNPGPGSVQVVGIADFPGGATVLPLPAGNGPIANLVFDVPCHDLSGDSTIAMVVSSATISDELGTSSVATLNADGAVTVRAGQCPPTAAPDGDRPIPGSRVFPNPASTSVSLSYSVSRPSRVSIEFYDIAGRRVRQLAARTMTAGRYEVTWDGLGDDGRSVPSGIYFYRLRTESGLQTGKIALVR